MITAALLGNPNVGKTTLFNQLTGSNQYVGNWAGVTVEKKEGYLNDNIKIVDLPGIYALDTYSNEEKISKNFLLGNLGDDVDLILNIVDASNLDRNLYLTTQLKQFNKPIILILNKVDIAESKGISIDYDILSKKLGVTVVPIVASKNIGTKQLLNIIKNNKFLDSIDNDNYYDKSEKEIYDYIDNILGDCIVNNNTTTTTTSDKIDKILLNKYLSYPAFFLILFLVFKFTFSWVGQPLADMLEDGLNNSIIPFLYNALSGRSAWFQSFIINGIVGGVGSVIVFLPIILTIFFCISFLEDSGYMARAALIMDKLMRKMGLSGKAFIPLILGFGCTVPAVMSARTLESEKDRKLTALLVPLMSCNARLPVYALFTSAFFPEHQELVIAFLYLLGICLAFLIGMFFKNTLFKKDEEPFIIELPKYELPQFKNLLKNTWEKGKGFLKKVGTIIFSISVVIWLLSNFNFSGLTDINSSFLSQIGRFISPIFVPLGFASWQNSISILTGLMAKEVIIGTMGVIYGGNLANVIKNHFTTASALSFLVFVLLYTPCISVIAAMRKEYGRKMATFSVVYQLGLAWIVSFVVYNIAVIFL